MIEVRGLESLVPQALLAGLSNKAVNEILFGIADAARAEWVRLAGKTYFTTRRDYVRGIQPVRLRPGVATISLVGDLPNMLEHGMPAQKLHETLLGPKVPLVPMGQRGKHRSKDGGEYRAIPFRHATPTAGGAVGQPMGRPYTGHDLVEDAKELGMKVYELASQLDPTIGKPGGKMAYGGRLGAGPSKDAYAALKVPKLRDDHAVDIYAGMIRSEKKYEKATQSFYMTFRTIAKGPDGKPRNSSDWITKKREGDMLHKKVDAFVQEIAEGAVKAYVEALG